MTQTASQVREAAEALRNVEPSGVRLSEVFLDEWMNISFSAATTTPTISYYDGLRSLYPSTPSYSGNFNVWDDSISETQWLSYVHRSNTLQRNDNMSVIRNAEMFIDTQYLDSPLSERHGFRYADWDYYHWEVIPVGSDMLRRDLIEFNAQCSRANDHHYEYQTAIKIRVANFRAQIKNQLSDSRKWRFDETRFYTKANHDGIRHTMKEFAKAVRDEDWEEALSALNTVNGWSWHVANRMASYASCDHEFYRCHSCTQYQDTDDDSSYDINGERICASCRENDYVWSECQNGYIQEDYAHRVYSSARNHEHDNSGDYCTWRYGQRNYYEYDGSFFTDQWERDEAAGYHDDDEYDDDDAPSGGRLSDYHGAYRNFVERNASNAYPALGIELEVYAKDDRASAVSELRELYSDLILERDGSLDCDQGFEIITQPYGREEWNEFAPNLTKTLIDLDVIGFNDPAGSNYGIHVTVHRRFFSPLAEARIMMFLTSVENTKFVQAIAQRSQIYGADSGRGFGSYRKGQSLRNINQEGLRTVWHRDGKEYDRNGRERYQKKIRGYGKYCPVNWKTNLAEFRIFQSTVNPSSFMKNLEFVWALHAWTKPEAATGSSFNHADFVQWLNTPERRREFPFLTAFLSKKKFYGTNYDPIHSSWHHLMVKPVESSAVEPALA